MSEPDSHPLEDTLIEYALGTGSDDVSRHVAACSQCRKFVDEMRAVRQSLASIDDEEVPINLGRRLAKSGSLSRYPSWVDDVILNWFRNPVVLTMGYLLYILLMYLVIAFLGGLSGEILK